MKKDIWIRHLLSIILSLFLISASTACLAANIEGSPFSEERDLKEATAEDTASSYLLFLAKYPDSSYQSEIEHRLLNLPIYQQAQAENAVWAYERYLSLYPDGRRAEEAKRAIEALEFEFYVKMNTLWGYQFFLKKYPNTKFAGEIANKKEQLRYAQANDEKEIASYELFLREFPAGRYADEIKEKVNVLKREKEEYRKSEESGTIEAYADFIRTHPFSPFASDASEKIASQMVSRISSGNHQPILASGLNSSNGGPLSVIHFKNSSRHPITLYLLGKEGFFETLKPGEGGSVRFLSGPYKIALRSDSPLGTRWAGSLDFQGEYLFYFESEKEPIVMIGVNRSAGKFPVKRRNGKLVSRDGRYAPEVFAEYNREAAQWRRQREGMLAAAYPLKREVPLQKILKLTRSQNMDERFGVLGLVERSKVRLPAPVLAEWVGDREIGKYILEGVDLPQEMIWPLIGIIKTESEGNNFVFKPPHIETVEPYIREAELAPFWRATEALVKIEKGAVEAMIEALRYCDDSARISLLSTLGQLAGPEHEPIFLDALEKMYIGFQHAALSGLVAIAGRRSAVPLLTIFFETSERVIHRNVLRALRAVADRGELDIKITPKIFSQWVALYEEWPDVFKYVPREKMDNSLLRMINSDDEVKRLILCAFLSENAGPQDFNRLTRCLADPRLPVKEMAIRGLARLKNDKVVDALTTFIGNKPLEPVKSKAILALGRIGTDKAISALVNLLKSSNDPIGPLVLGGVSSPKAAEILVELTAVERYANEVCNALEQSGKIAIPTLRKGIASPEGRVGYHSMRCLGRIRDHLATQALYEMLKDKDIWIRKDAIEAIYLHEIRVMKKEAPHTLLASLKDPQIHHEEVIDYLYKEKVKAAADGIKELFTRDVERGEINYSAINALYDFGERKVLEKAFPLLTGRLLGDGQVNDWRVFDALGKIGNDKAVEILLDQTKQPNRMWDAIQALGKSQNQKATVSLLALLRELKVRPPRLYELVQTLGELKDPRAVEALKEVLMEPSTRPGSQLHSSLLSALRKIGGVAAQQALLAEAVRSGDTFNGLQELNSEVLLDDLARLSKNGTLQTRKQVVFLLGNIKNQKAMGILKELALNSTDLDSEAIIQLGRIGEPAFNDLLDLLEKVRGKKREAVIAALGETKKREAILPLAKVAAATGLSVDASLYRIVPAVFPEFFIPLPALDDIAKRLKNPQPVSGSAPIEVSR